MQDAPLPPDGHASRFPRFGRGPILKRGALVALAGLGIVGGLSHSGRAPSTAPAPEIVAETAPAPLPALDYEAINTLRGALLASLSPAAEAVAEAVPETATPFAQQEPVETPESPEEATQLAQTVPLPVPRPPELRGLATPDLTRRADRTLRRSRSAAIAPAQPAEDTRSFFDKLFGVPQQPASPALAYAALETPPLTTTPRPQQLSPSPSPPSGGGVAVYDISARTVTLPSGEKLEAHSGLGPSMDNPRYVDQRMRGATPPGTYDLTEREALFHGVRAIRLNPVGGAAAVYGRAGLLAHTYMLGPSGASNGCVSFRDYAKFLQAYLRGEVARLVVVAGAGADSVPSVASSRGRTRTARADSDG